MTWYDVLYSAKLLYDLLCYIILYSLVYYVLCQGRTLVKILLFYKQGSVAVFNIVCSMVSRILCELAAYRIHGMTHYTN